MRREMEQMNADFDEIRQIMGPMFRDLGGDLNHLGSIMSGHPGLNDPNGSFTSTSTSISITTSEDGSLQETRTVRTIGPDGVPKEETTVRNIDTGDMITPFPLRGDSMNRRQPSLRYRY